MTERPERCELCRWWLHTEAHDDDKGDCRRYPPTIVDAEGFGEWIETYPTDFCGEFRPRDPRGFPG